MNAPGSHECARVTFVTVADHVFLIILGIQGELPFSSGRETGAAASADSGSEHFVDDFLTTHAERSPQALERAHAEGFIDILGIDDAAAVQSNTALFLIEVDIILPGNLFSGRGFDIKQAFNYCAVDNIRFNDLLDILQMHQAIEGIFRIDLNERTLRAESEASDHIDRDTVRAAFLRQYLFELFRNLTGMVGKTSGSAAQHDMPFSIRSGDLIPKVTGTCGNTLIELIHCINHAFTHSFALFCSLILVDDLRNLRCSHLRVDSAVNADRRSDSAGTDAAERIQCKEAVLRCLTRLDLKNL